MLRSDQPRREVLFVSGAWWRQFAFMFLLAFVFTAVSAPAFAQMEQAKRQLDNWPKQLEELEKSLKQPDIDDEGLVAIKNKLEEARNETLKLRTDLQPGLKKVQDLYDKLGPKPEKGKEPTEISAKRTSLEEQLETIQALIRRLDVNALRTSQLADSAAEIQRERFTKRVLSPSRSVLNPVLWLDGAVQFKTLWDRVSRAIVVWFEAFKLNLTSNVLLILAGAVAAILLVLYGFRRLFSRILGPDLNDPEPSQLEKLWLATRTPLVNCVTALLAFVVVYLALKQAGFMTLRLERMLKELTNATLLYVAVRALTRGILAPDRPLWRLPEISDETALTLKRYIDLLALFLALDIFFKFLSSALFMPVQFVQPQIASLGIFIVVTTVLLLVNVPRKGTSEEVHGPVMAGAAGSFVWAAKSRNLVWLIIFAIGLALLFGFLALGHLLSEQLIKTSVLVVLIYLLHCLMDEILTTGLKPGWVLGDFFRRNLGLTNAGLSRVALFGSTIFDLILVFIGLPLIISNWAITWVDLESWMNKLFFGFQVGSINISLSVVILAIAAFFGGLLVTRLFTKWLDQRVLSRTRLNSGVKDSIKTATGYSGFILASLFAISFTGLDFSKVAIVAGALSVGIGFGLQSVVNNFVSGLILLVERPIKVGDWVVVSGGEGIVKNIKVRSTEIETFDRATVIVPNSSLISDSVQNWTHSNTVGRIKILVGVSYDADPKQVEEILLSCASEQEDILKAPAPWVYFKDFGASSLDFELRVYLYNVDLVSRVASSLRYSIFERFKEANIEIPYPQRDVNIRDMDRLEDILVSKDKG